MKHRLAIDRYRDGEAVLGPTPIGGWELGPLPYGVLLEAYRATLLLDCEEVTMTWLGERFLIKNTHVFKDFPFADMVFGLASLREFLKSVVTPLVTGSFTLTEPSRYLGRLTISVSFDTYSLHFERKA